MAPIRQQRTDRLKSSATGPYTRSRRSLRGAPATQIRPQSTSSNRYPPRKDESTGTSKPPSVTCHTSYPHHIPQVVTPQRSSLRCALRESQKLSDENDPIGTSAPLDSTPPDFQNPGQGPRNPAQSAPKDIRTGSATTLSSASPHVQTLRLNPQRSSLRRAIYESLKVLASGNDEPGPSTYLSKLDLARSSAPSPESIEKRQTRRHTWLPSSFERRTALTPTLPQRSSLRRAIRESFRVTTQGNDPVDLTPAVVISAQGFVPTDTVKEPLPSSEGQGNGITLTPTSPETILNLPLTPIKDVDTAEGVLEISCTPSISSATPSPAPRTSVPRELVTVLRPRKKMVSESPSMVMETQDAQSSPTLSNPLSCLSPSTRPRNDLSSSKAVAGHQIPNNPFTDQGILDNRQLGKDMFDSEPLSTRKGWHQIREIVNEVPSGLYLVEWEGRDPRTGVKVGEIRCCASGFTQIYRLLL
ncbi:hypothetical protein RRF57_011696 [Xylaria bambusicola]|uniref:Uncharacterized protein n=1 Tax=Xylaria bambusicola TaxID=326684 RepID=A0AAN7V312_9PEZI